MKKIKLLGYLMILMSGFMFLQCTSDEPIYVAGEAGVDGADGVNGVDGVGAAECIACHSNSHREDVYASFEFSGHALGTHTGGNYGSRESCAQCHSNDGYVDVMERGFVQPGGYYTYGPPMYELDGDGNVVLEDDPDSPVFGLPVITNESFNNSSKIRCTTCHNSHSSFDFENDGNDMALRQAFRPATMLIDPSVTIDMGLSNTCVNCHQPRDSYAVPGPTDDYTITSSRFGPHHGPQSTMVYGLFGAEVAGSVTYPTTPGASQHAQVSCTGCHMGETTDGEDGAHSFWPTNNSCIQCHDSGIETLVVTNFEADFATLHTLLVDMGAITDSGSTVSNQTWPAPVAQAIWNYRTLLEDKSHGIHNPTYAKALLTNSIEAVQN